MTDPKTSPFNKSLSPFKNNRVSDGSLHLSGSPLSHQSVPQDQESEPPTPCPCPSTPASPNTGAQISIEMEELDFKPSSRRWVVLLIQMLLNLVSDLVCFSIAPIEDIAILAYPGLNPDLLVTLFFLGNVLGCLWEPWVLHRTGLRTTVTGGAALMAFGNLIKSGNPFTDRMGSGWVTAGFVLVGIAQPFFQVTAVTLVQDWFPVHERPLATMIAVNSNQVGIGLAYLFGHLLITDPNGLEASFHGYTWFSIVLLFFAISTFRSRPQHPPSRSAASQWESPKPVTWPWDYWLGALSMLKMVGVPLAVLVFCLGATIANVVATLLPELLTSIGNGDKVTIGLVGASFQLAIGIGSWAAGVVFGKHHAYRIGTIALLATSSILLIILSTLFDYGVFSAIIPTLVFLGAFAGPLIPLGADLGVELVYPYGENGILFLCEVLANLFSAASIAIFDAMKDWTNVEYGSSLYSMTVVTIAMLVSFTFLFRGECKRYNYDQRAGIEATLL